MYLRNTGVPRCGLDDSLTKPDDSFVHILNGKLPADEVATGLEFWHRLPTTLAK